MTVLRLTTTRTAAGVLLTLLAVGLVSPIGARAGCLHPLAGGTIQGTAHLDRLASAGALALADTRTAPVGNTPRCAGLRCSNEPARVPSSPSATTPRVDDWGCLSGSKPPPGATSYHLFPVDPPARPTHGGPAPFDPPR